MLRKLKDYIKTDLWRIHLRSLPPAKARLIRQLRIIVLSIRCFIEDKCQLRATSLAFFTLLSLGPAVALAFGAAKGFGMEKYLETQIVDKIPAQEELLKQVITYAHALLENTKGGVVAGIGIVLLIWSVLKLLNHIELSFNEIWNIEKSRSWKRKISNHLSFIVIAPILLLMYTSLPAYISSHIFSQKIALLQTVSPLLFPVLKLTPYVIVSIVFTVIFLLIPNTRVKVRSGLLGGLISGLIFMVVQMAYIKFQIGVTRYNPIYGSIAALPLLLVWLNVGWVILLFGAEYSFAHQNVDMYEFEPDYENISPYFYRLLTLQVLHLISTRFSQNCAPLNASDISQCLEIPQHRVLGILNDLVDGRLLSVIQKDDSDDPVFQPASDINLWTVTFVIEALERNGVNYIPMAETEEMKKLREVMDDVGSAIKASPANKLIKDI